MPVTTSQQITRYFNQFSQAEVTFTREVVHTLLLNTKHVHLKCMGSHWPCIIYAASMTTAKIIANLKSGLNECLRNANNVVQLRFSFAEPDKPDPITFFIPARVVASQPYGEKTPDLFFASLEYTQRPPDDLIQILGQFLEANVNAKRRREERIPLSPHSIRQLGLVVDACGVSVDGVPRNTIIRDLSFSGCKAILAGIAKMLVSKPVVVRLVFNDPEQAFQIPGVICRYDPVEGHEEIAAFGIQFAEDKVPMAYKMRINSALKLFRSKSADT
ncbi:MAG: PilZN3 domain-containing protein [Spirochaetota bacterium]